MKIKILFHYRIIVLWLFLAPSFMFSQAYIMPTSTIACDQSYSTESVTNTAGFPPYSYTVQTPNCGSTYTASSQATIQSFSFGCPGVYTITARDGSYAFMGLMTHTVILSTFINVDLYTATGRDTICLTDVISLIDNTSASGYTLSQVNWSDGDIGYNTIVSPTITTTYSMSALYTSMSTRTCSATGSITIVVIQCATSIGVNEGSSANIAFKLYPNPAHDAFNIVNNNNSNAGNNIVLSMQDVTGRIVKEKVLQLDTDQINLNDLSNGVYIITLRNDKKLLYKTKLLKQD